MRDKNELMREINKIEDNINTLDLMIKKAVPEGIVIEGYNQTKSTLKERLNTLIWVLEL